jgi:hypothetical protein
MNLSDLEEIDELRQISFGERECFLHKEHRWVLPIIFYKQKENILPYPCTLVTFDAHHDSLDPTCSCKEDILRIRKLEITFDEIVHLCQEKLSDRDDDWIKAGMELGLINDVVIFGVEDGAGNGNLKKYEDQQGIIHKIKLLGLPREELDYQGDLSDIIRSEALSEFWKILGWQCTSQFSFVEDERKILLDFDLDCFIVRWRGYHFPWPEEVFKKEFPAPLNHRPTSGWTGKGFLNGLINKAALITIAREPDFCHGEKKATEILGKVNHFLFDDKLNLDKTPG